VYASIALATLLFLSIVCVAACADGGDGDPRRVEPIYDVGTGKLQLLKYDSDGNGKTDIWCHMDGTRVVRIEVDENDDGKIDRWQYYDRDQRIEKVGSSTRMDGKEDIWAHHALDGTVTRIDSSLHQAGKVSRIEYFEKRTLTRAEEDTDGDGRMDKWETYEAAKLTAVAFDTAHRGVPDRRIVYDDNSNGRVEVDMQGTGRFAPIPDATPAGRTSRVQPPPVQK